MIDTIPGSMTKEEAEKAAEEWQRQQDVFPGSIPPPEEKPPVVHNDFYGRQQERAQGQENYIRNGSG